MLKIFSIEALILKSRVPLTGYRACIDGKMLKRLARTLNENTKSTRASDRIKTNSQSVRNYKKTDEEFGPQHDDWGGEAVPSDDTAIHYEFAKGVFYAKIN
jgi:hypothetical protein